MNQGGPGQQPQGTPQAQAAQLAAARMAQIPMYKPDQMRNIALLTEDEKIKYEKGLTQLWSLHDSKPLGSAENLDARKKLQDFGKMLQSKVAGRRHQMQQQQRTQQQFQQGQQQPGQQQPQQTQQNTNAQQHPGNQQTPQQQPSHPSGPAPGGNTQQAAPGQPAAPTTNAPQGGPQPGLPQNKIPEHIMAHVNQMRFIAPPGTPDPTKFVSELKLRYTRALLTMESGRANVARIDQMIKDRAEKGNPFTPEEQASFVSKKEQLQKQYGEGHAYVERIRQQMATFQKNAQQQQNGGGQGPKPGSIQLQQPPAPRGMQAPPAQAGGNQTSGVGAGANPMQSSAATVSAAIEAAKSQQLAAAGRMQNQQNQQQGQQGQQGLQGLPQSQIVPPSIQPQNQHSPVVHQAPTPQSQPQHQQLQPQTQNQLQNQAQMAHQQPHIKLEPGTHPHPNMPAPINTALASATLAQGLPSAGTPTSNLTRAALQTPQSATPTSNQPRPLSHSAALTMANQRTGSIGLPPAAGGANTPQSTPGTASGVIGAAPPLQQTANQHHIQPHMQHMHPGVGQQQGHGGGGAVQSGVQSKFAIPKVLPEKATQVPTPAPSIGGIGVGRPTFSGGSGLGGGVMGQPALAKTPMYQLEGEGDRVLNKKKLDELVRQVCGGTAEGDESSLLTPDVEEVRVSRLSTDGFTSCGCVANLWGNSLS